MNLAKELASSGWKFLKATKNFIFVILVVISLIFNVAQYTGHVVVEFVEAAVKSTLGISSVAARATARATKATASAAKLATQVVGLKATAKAATLRATKATTSAAKLATQVVGLKATAKAATLRATKATTSAANLTTQVVGLKATTRAATLRATKTAEVASSLRLKLANAAAAAQVIQRTALAKQKAKMKAKARLKRSLVAIPIMGVALVVLFEEQDYREWAIENPKKGRAEYACEVATYSAEVIDEVVSDTLDATEDWSDRVKPDSEWVKSKLMVPKCDE